MSCLAGLNDKKAKVLCSLIIAATTFIVMLFCAAFTSPLYPYYNGLDSSIFLTIAKGISEGKTVYVDLFDHKGPIFFWIESIGYVLKGRTGVWIIEYLFALVDLFFLHKICRELKSGFAIPALVFSSIMLYTFSHGNITEEICTPFVLISSYLSIKYFTSARTSHPPIYGFIYGIFFAIIAFIRLNNSVIICGFVLCISIALINNKEWKNLLHNGIAALTGIAIVTIPICLYFKHIGALNDMIYATFLYNFVYASGETHKAIFSADILKYLVLYLPGIFSFIVFTKKSAEHQKLSKALAVITIITYGLLIYANIYEHYFVTGAPLPAIASAYVVQGRSLREICNKAFISKPLSILLIIVLFTNVLLAAYSAAAPFYKSFCAGEIKQEYLQVSKSLSIIPEDEKNSVIGFGIFPVNYMYGDITPCYKYYTLQRWWTTDELNVYGEFIVYLKTEHPLWLITKCEETDSEILSIISDNYDLITKDDYNCYYRYNGGNK